MPSCRFLFHRASSDFILATEEVITRSVGRGLAPVTARVNVFSPPAVLIGFNQNVYEEVDVDEVKRLGYDINRRPTGGGAILMYEDTPGWEIWVPENFPGLPPDVEGRYRFLIQVPIRALQILGVKEARFRPKNDIEVYGRKISGTGLYTESGGVMLCGTILLDFDVELMLKVLRLPIEKISDKAIKSFEDRIITVKKILGYKPSVEELVRAFKEAIREVLGLEPEAGDLSEVEKEDLNKTMVKYRDPKWVYEFRRGSGFTKCCIKKTSGGLIRVHAKVYENVVEQVLITGDFFVYPQRAIQDLEARLKWVSIDDVKNEVLKFFNEYRASILGLSPSELAEMIDKCIREGSS